MLAPNHPGHQMNSTVKRTITGIAAMILLGSLVVGVLLGSAVYGWKAAQRAGNEAATIQNMNTIAAVEVQYYNTHNRTFGTFDQLIKEEMLTSKFSGDLPVSEHYVLTLHVTSRNADQQSAYTLNVDPVSGDATTRHFYIDSITGSIHVNEDQPAGPTDPPLEE